MNENKKRICIISDTHGMHNSVAIPKCDFLICCGDHIEWVNEENVREFYGWLVKAPAKHIIQVLGNHDVDMRKMSLSKIIPPQLSHLVLLENQTVEIDGIKIYGCGFQISQIANGNTLSGIKVPVDIIVTHEPPFDILDEKDDKPTDCHYSKGSKVLLNSIKKAKAKLICFGHVHNCFRWEEKYGKIYVNAALKIDNPNDKHLKASSIHTKPFLFDFDGNTFTEIKYWNI